MKRLIIGLVLFSICLISLPVLAADRVVVVPLGAKAKTVQQTFIYHLHPSDFFMNVNPAAADKTFRMNGEYLSVKTASKLVAPIKLPAGAVVTQIDCSIYDVSSDSNFSASSNISFWRRPVSSTTTQAFANPVKLYTVGSTSLLRPTLLPTILYPVIESNYAYGASINLLFTSPPVVYSQLRFYGCQLRYKLDVVVP